MIDCHLNVDDGAARGAMRELTIDELESVSGGCKNCKGKCKGGCMPPDGCVPDGSICV